MVDLDSDWVNHFMTLVVGGNRQTETGHPNKTWWNGIEDDTESLGSSRYSGVTPIGQGWTNARGLRGLGGPKPDPKIHFCVFTVIEITVIY